MKEYIEREAVLAFADRVRYVKNEDVEAGIQGVLIFVRDEIPAADVRPVVRCKDCKHRFMTPNGWHCHYAEWAIEGDDFCSCGEKREG